VLEITCEQVRCPRETALRDVTFLVSSPSMPFEIISDQISILSFCDDSAVLKIASLYSSLGIPEYICHNFASWSDYAKLSGEVTKRRDSRPCFAPYFRDPSDEVRSHLQSQVVKRSCWGFY